MPVTFTLASSKPKTLRSPEGEKQKGPRFSSQTQRWFGREVRAALASLQGADLRKPESQQAPPGGAGVDAHGLEALLLETEKEGEVVDRGPVCSSHQAFSLPSPLADSTGWQRLPECHSRFRKNWMYRVRKACSYLPMAAVLVTRQAEQTVLFARKYQERGTIIACYLKLGVAVLLSFEEREVSVCEKGSGSHTDLITQWGTTMSSTNTQDSFFSKWDRVCIMCAVSHHLLRESKASCQISSRGVNTLTTVLMPSGQETG